MRIRSLAYRLQAALCHEGRRVKINQRQSWSDERQRMLTKYQLLEEMETEEGRKYITVLETWQLVEVVRALAAMYGGE